MEARRILLQFPFGQATLRRTLAPCQDTNTVRTPTNCLLALAFRLLGIIIGAEEFKPRLPASKGASDSTHSPRLSLICSHLHGFGTSAFAHFRSRLQSRGWSFGTVGFPRFLSGLAISRRGHKRLIASTGDCCKLTLGTTRSGAHTGF